MYYLNNALKYKIYLNSSATLLAGLTKYEWAKLKLKWYSLSLVIKNGGLLTIQDIIKIFKQFSIND